MNTIRMMRIGWTAVGCAAIALLAAPETAAAADTPPDHAALEKQLADARARLDAAARDVAKLSEQLYGDQEMQVFKFIHGGPSGAMLGVNIGGSRERDEGVEVVGVSPDGPAERAGLRAGDVILAVNGQALKKSSEGPPAHQLVSFMRTVEPGQTVKVDYLRAGKRQTADVKTTAAEPPMARIMRERMRAMPMLEGMDMPPFHPMMMPEGAFGALELVPVTPNLGRYFGAETGMLVVRAPGQPGLPLEEGDVLLTIGGRTPESPGQAFRILNSYEPGEKVKLGILRNRKRVEVEATVPPRGGPMGQPRSPMPPTPSAPPQPAPPQGRTSST